jgi:tRNA nucleotidyltransferase (CCA-adding enzyme)
LTGRARAPTIGGVERRAPPRRIEVEVRDPRLAAAKRELAERVRSAGGRALLVGGCVRDAALGRPAVDLDFEVHGLPAERLVALLEERYRLDLVGRDFGVLKLRGLPVDVSLPRRESKRGLGHRGFEIHSDPHLGPREAAARRDFTVNAMAADPLTGELIDPHGGMADLAARVLRHVGERFAEDPLRVLRGMQLAARFELAPAPETLALCRGIGPEGLARERIFGEWRKLLLLGVRPSLGLGFLRDCGWLRHTPELAALVGCEQDPAWHPEGDVFVHTLHCLDAFAAERVGDETEDLVVGLAVLCHDLGKPATTRREDGRVTSKGHEPVGEALARRFLARLTGEVALVEAVVPLVGAHLRPGQLHQARAGDAAVRRLARRVGRIDRLVRVARADWRGRPPLGEQPFVAGEWLLARARALELEAAAPRPLVLGRHLIALGLEPGPHFGPILEACFEAQLDGAFASLESGLEFARAWLAAHPPGPSAGARS